MLLPACPARSPISRPALPYYDKSLLRVIHSNGTDLRGRIFGHPDSMVTLDQGFFAKFVGLGEVRFYEVYQAELSSILPCDLIPEVVGIVFPTADRDFFDFQRTMRVLPGEHRRPMILQRDLVANYERPAIIDFKIGNRSWRIGASPNKANRRATKMAAGTCAQTFFRVRAAMWYSDHFDRVPGTAISCVSRKFGNTCTMDELRKLFRDFFRPHHAIPFFVQKLERLKNALIHLRKFYQTRFYSSSVVIAYDDADPEMYDLRMLDFEKSYLCADQVARNNNEPIEDCEDHVIEAVENLQMFLIELRQDDQI